MTRQSTFGVALAALILTACSGGSSGTGGGVGGGAGGGSAGGSGGGSGGGTGGAGSCVVGTQGGGAPAGYVQVPAGCFVMGSPTSEPGRAADETPHQVTLTRSFYLKATEVTQAEWTAEVANNPSSFTACGSSCPVEKVSWWDVVAYCNALSQKQGLAQCYALTGCTGTPGTSGYSCTDVTFAGPGCLGYRLPTEAEWEYAARAGTTDAFYTGPITNAGGACGTAGADPNLDLAGWYCSNAMSTTHAAGSKQANAWGLKDMLGNVSEWCGDWAGTYPAGAATDPTGLVGGGTRVVRGSSWVYGAKYQRAAQRGANGPTIRGNILGFRPARSAP